MPRRRFLFLSLAAVVVGLAVGVWSLWPGPSLITLENFDRIEKGMPQQEVECLLGGPGKFYGYESPLTGLVFTVAMIRSERRLWFQWGDGDNFTIWLEFDKDNRVAGRACGGPRNGVGVMAGVRRWVGL